VRGGRETDGSGGRRREGGREVEEKRDEGGVERGEMVSGGLREGRREGRGGGERGG